MKKYVTSPDGETFDTGTLFDSKEDAVKWYFDGEPDETVVFVGTAHERRYGDYVMACIVEDLLEIVSEAICEISNEEAAEYFENSISDTEPLRKLISNWFDENVPGVWYDIKDIEEVTK